MDLLKNQSAVMVRMNNGECCCHRCLTENGLVRCFMVLCPECGNKRCPKASDHHLACTKSNKHCSHHAKQRLDNSTPRGAIHGFQFVGHVLHDLEGVWRRL